MKYGRKNKKGFTLIELLAVIVILAVIALIAVPIIMNVINDSKKGAAKDSMYSYVKAVELAATKDMKPDTDLLSGTYTVKDGNLYTGSTKVLNVDLKGTKPANDGSVKLEKGQVKSADLKFDGYCIGYDGNEAVNKDNCEVAPPTSNPSGTYTEGDIIYYNPETNKKCTVGELNTTANAKTGCLKWNIITMGDTTSKTTVDIMLDHNTTSKVAWLTKEDYIAAGGTEADYGSLGLNEYGPITVIKQLKTDVGTWNSTIKSTARLISGQEVADIGRDTVWNEGKFIGTTYSSQSWLYQNTKDNGDDTNYGYWSDTANSLYTSDGWCVNFEGYLFTTYVSHSDGFGVRPVITVSKTTIA